MRLYGLIGYPLGHSFSKQYFTEKFAREGLSDCVFEAFPIPGISLFQTLLKENPTLKGLAVTIPYKEQVLQFIDEHTEEVEFIGATNCIKISSGKLLAYNTDIIGFEESLIKSLKSTHSKALVLGTGGASKAVQFVLRKLGIDFQLVSRVANPGAQLISYSEVDDNCVTAHPLIINCTPLGMYPKEDTFPDIPYDAVTPGHYFFDLVYKPESTKFLQKGSERGATLKNGYEMLLIQAEANWKIWNDL